LNFKLKRAPSVFSLFFALFWNIYSKIGLFLPF
jgi:hypothetical protein